MRRDGIRAPDKMAPARYVSFKLNSIQFLSMSPERLSSDE
jgi:hypothetical protein